MVSKPLKKPHTQNHEPESLTKHLAVTMTLMEILSKTVISLYLPSRDGDKMAPSVEKKIAELEMGLLHLQQNIEIPEISLLIHPIITNIAKQCYERGEKPKVTDFGDKVEDPTFLNQLQSGVNRWIREIQKVRGIPVFLSKT